MSKRVVLELDDSIRCAFINYVARNGFEMLMGSHCIDTDDIKRGEPIVITVQKEDGHDAAREDTEGA